ncbi:RING-H2 finger protein ATL7 [Morella rubra]|uniref:RING-H2 finger protein ATL7 n=1 Tax=Morella rubra TaxID=262757 RepID=A0A6A1UY30_9ROSI|nr:RING-H2 finger protein ATL7 [Morella rubra]
MGLPCFSTNFPELTVIIIPSRNLCPVLVKNILIWLFSYLPDLLGKVFYSRRCEDDHDQPLDRPSPALVPVPFHLLGEPMKKQLPTVQYSDILKRRGAFLPKDSVCAICRNYMEASDGVRELCNCSHVFHGECLDIWIGKDHVTCPLCRSKLSPILREDLKVGGDPWRMERRVYLFGED